MGSSVEMLSTENPDNDEVEVSLKDFYCLTLIAVYFHTLMLVNCQHFRPDPAEL